MDNRGESPNQVFSNSSKLFAFPKEVESVLKGETIAPITLEIQPSSDCNHACPKCSGKLNKESAQYKEIQKQSTFINTDIVKGIVESKNPPLGVVFAGDTGDPLIHPQIESLIDIIHDKKIAISVVTNGQALNPQISQTIVQKCQGLRVSLDAFDAKSHHLTHGSDDEQWNELLKNIKDIVDLRNKLSTKSDCLLGVGYLTGKHTYEGMYEATLLAKNLGVDYIHFRPFFYSDDEINPELIEKCKTLEDENFSVIFPEAKYKNLQDRNYPTCKAANFVTVINPKGETYLCCHHIGQSDYKIDTISTNPEDWDNFVNGEKRHELIEKHKLIECPPFCRLHGHNQVLSRLTPEDLLNRSLSITQHAKFL
jgi:MoaA/NifB/PqqE/SkfB family radical SAM enzyme